MWGPYPVIDDSPCGAVPIRAEAAAQITFQPRREIAQLYGFESRHSGLQRDSKRHIPWYRLHKPFSGHGNRMR